MSDDTVDFDYIINGNLPDEYNIRETEEDEGGELADILLDDGVSELPTGDDNEQSEDEEEEDGGARAEDKAEEERINKFLEDTCRCQLRDGKPCSGEMTYCEVMNYRADILQLTRSEVDLVIITAIRNSLHSSSLTSQGTKRRYERLCLRLNGERIREKNILNDTRNRRQKI